MRRGRTFLSIGRIGDNFFESQLFIRLIKSNESVKYVETQFGLRMPVPTPMHT